MIVVRPSVVSSDYAQRRGHLCAADRAGASEVESGLSIGIRAHFKMDELVWLGSLVLPWRVGSHRHDQRRIILQTVHCATEMNGYLTLARHSRGEGCEISGSLDWIS